MEMLGQCKEPTPVLKQARDFTKAADREYFPQCTIIHECRAESGCCGIGYTCGPKTIDTIKKTFFVSIPGIFISYVNVVYVEV